MMLGFMNAPRRRYLARDQDEIAGPNWLMRWLCENIAIPGGSLIVVGNNGFSREENIFFQYTERIMPGQGSYWIEVMLDRLHVERTPC